MSVAARHLVDAHDFIVGAVRHAIVVIADQEDDRQTEFAGSGIVIVELGLCREIQGFQHDAVSIGTGTQLDDHLFEFASEIAFIAISRNRAAVDFERRKIRPRIAQMDR